MDRREILAEIQKATIERSVGGQLNPEQSKAFIQEVMAKSAFGTAINLERSTAPEGEMSKMGNASRLVRGRKENTDDGYRAGVDTDEITYLTKDLWLPFEVTEDFFHENIESESVEPKIVNRMTRQFALDLDDLNINGDEESADDFVGLDDGLVKKVRESGDAHIVDVNDHPISHKVFLALKYAMPDIYVNSGRLRWLMSPNRWTNWIESLIERETNVGDAALVAKDLYPLGIPPFIGASSDDSQVMPGLPFWPDDLIVLADMKNFTRVVSWDIERKKVTGETDWGLATRRKRGYVFFIKQDFIILEEKAVAAAENIGEIDTEFDFDEPVGSGSGS